MEVDLETPNHNGCIGGDVLYLDDVSTPKILKEKC